MCEIRIISYPNKDNKIIFRVDIAGYQNQIKTVSSGIQYQEAADLAVEWHKLTNFAIQEYKEETITEKRLTKDEYQQTIRT